MARGAACLAILLAVSMPAFADPPPLRIGVLTDMNGPYSDAAGPGSVTAAQLAVAEFGPTVLGRRIEIVAADHQNKPDLAVSIARTWFDTDGVDMITDLTNSSVAIAVQALATEKHKIDLITSTATTAVTEEDCSPTGMHWTFDSYALTVGTGRALVSTGAKKWFFITADYTFGANLQRTAAQEIERSGGQVLGSAKAPLNTTDFASQLIAAQASGADVIGLANSGADTANSVKQAMEFGLTQRQKVAAFLPFITDIKAIGLQNAQGLILTTAFYWDRDDASRDFAQRFWAKQHAEPTMIQAGTYSAVLHYLRAVRDAGTTNAAAVADRMRALPVHDAVFAQGSIRADGRMVHDMYLVQVKTPAESKGPWDLYKVLRTIPGDQTVQPLTSSACKLVHPAG
ncbi:MAG TPA: ABC transporter substrate-binding protein [Rhodopila sp.]|nr:ABC transporter substrate-binding protein [Rhodopila sp.]